MDRGTWQYQEEISPSAVNHVWKVVAIMVASTTALLVIAALLPHDQPRDWTWLGPGLAVINALLVLLGLIAWRTRATAGNYAPPPLLTLALGLIALVGLTLMSIGLSGPFAIYREIILVPAIVLLACGNRRMVLTIAVATIAAVAVAGVAQGLPRDAIPALVVAYGFGWGGVLGIIRLIEQEAVRGMQRHRLVADMAASVATAGDPDAGLAALLPLAGSFLDATAIEVRTTTAPSRTVAGWSRTGREPAAVPTGEDVDAAVTSGQPIVRPDHTVLPVSPIDASGPLVAVITAETPDLRNRLTFEHDVDQTRIHLDLLANRVHLLSQLERLSRTDDLTGLANRRTLLERLDHEMALTRRRDEPLALVMIDVDHFKSFNDAFGHQAGDEALVAVSGALRVRLRETDLASRYGGEEFCLVLPHTTTAEAADIVGELHARCRELTAQRPLTFSAGIAGSVPGEAPERLIGRADDALYRAKLAGRDRSQVADAVPAVQRLGPTRHDRPPNGVDLERT